MTNPTPPTIGRDHQARGLLAALGVTYRDATIAIGHEEWIVYLLGPWKAPDLSEWCGLPVRYERIGEITASAARTQPPPSRPTERPPARSSDRAATPATPTPPTALTEALERIAR